MGLILSIKIRKKPNIKTAAIIMAALSLVGVYQVFRSHAAGFPDASNTGVPAGTNLSAYTGPNPITSCGTVIDSKIINGIDIHASNGTTSASTPCVTIKNSQINGPIDDSYSTSAVCGSHPCGPVNITDSNITYDNPHQGNVIETNFNLLRVNEKGGRTGAICDGYCTLTDSYLHDNYFVSPEHMGSFMSNGNGGRAITLTHNTFFCNVEAGSPGAGNSNGGCSGDLNFFGDFATISNIVVNNNYFSASTGDFYYCVNTGAFQNAKAFPTGNHLTWTNNVFQAGASGKCGDAGPVSDWQAGNSNVWCNNRYDNGVKLSITENCPSGSPAPAPTPPPPTPTPPAPAPSPPPTSLPPVQIQAAPSQKVTIQNGVTTVTNTVPQTVGSAALIDLAPVVVGDNVTIVKVVFFIDNKQFGSTTAGPFNLKVDPYRLRNGTHAVFIRSYTSDNKTVVTKQTLQVYIPWYKRFGHWVWTPVGALSKKK